MLRKVSMLHGKVFKTIKINIVMFFFGKNAEPNNGNLQIVLYVAYKVYGFLQSASKIFLKFSCCIHAIAHFIMRFLKLYTKCMQHQNFSKTCMQPRLRWAFFSQLITSF